MNISRLNKTVVIIPSYEPSHAFVDYAKDILDKGFCSLIVVNDGSNDKYSYIFSELSEIKGCKVISYPQNHGKGYALKTAFKYCKEVYGKDYVFVTADCDGQHLVKDVEKTSSVAFDRPNELILGSRDFSLNHVPARSKAGNLNIRRLFKFFYGISLSDTQTGLRAFSYELLDDLIATKGDRFEYEMNMLIVFHKKHIRITEVPIETIYNPKEEDVERVSHFKTFSDSLRVISTLFQNLGWYVISSVISALIDMSAFFILSTYVFISSSSILYNALLATVSARIISSLFNFTFNFKFVFNGQSKSAFFKYYLLWTCQLCVSWGTASLWNYLFDIIAALSPIWIGLLTTLCKSACDFLVAILSYQIQCKWVFVSKKKH